MPNWSKLVVGWVVAALVALAFAWGAVAQVRNRVIQPTTEIPATVVAAAAGTDMDSSSTSTTTIPVIRVDPEPAEDSTTSTTVGDFATSTTQHTTSSTTPTTSAGQASTTTTTSPTTTTAPSSNKTSTHTLVGGQVRISHSPGVVNFISAIPQPGFSTEVQEDGPDEVRIRFVSDSHKSDFRARWEDGELRITSSEEEEG